MRQLDTVSLKDARRIGRQFASWLNITGGTRLVLRLLDLEQKIRHLERELTDYLSEMPDDGPESDDVSDEMMRSRDAMTAQFNQMIARFKVYPQLIDTDFEKAWKFRWDLVRAPRKQLKPMREPDHKWTTDDLSALFGIVRLAQSGYLSRVKMCARRGCNKWFFERTWSQEYCDPKCRQWMFSKSEEFKAHRREYMRRYYRLQRSANVK